MVLIFFQLLEGPRTGVQMIYRAICQDPRHYNIVELLCDYAPARRLAKQEYLIYAFARAR